MRTTKENKEWPWKKEGNSSSFEDTIQWPRITIVTPSYNQGQYLEETILSVLNQGYPNLEYIVIDGGSTDSSVEIIKKYSNHFAYWVSEKDNGQSEAINKGFKKATGDIVAWLNSDDYHLPHCLKTVALRFIENNSLGFVFGNSLIFGYRKNNEILYNKDSVQITMADFLMGMPYSQTSTFYNRKAIEKVGILDERLHYCMDYDFSVRILMCFEVLRLKEVLSKSRFHLESKSSKSRNNFRKENISVFSKLINTLDFEVATKEKLAHAGLFISSEVPVPLMKKFDQDFLSTLLKRYVLEIVRHAYSGFAVEEVKEYCKNLKKEFPDQYDSFEVEQFNRKSLNYSYLLPQFKYYLRRKIKELLFK